MRITTWLTLLFISFTFFAKGQQTTNTTGDIFSHGEYVLTFSMGETINDLFTRAEFLLKAGVIQSFKTACPLPSTFAFQQLNNLCIPEGGASSLALSGSELYVRYLLSLNEITSQIVLSEQVIR